MSEPQTLETLRAMRRAASEAGMAARARYLELWRAERDDRSLREARLEWSWITQACRRELKRLNNLIARRMRAQQVAA